MPDRAQNPMISTPLSQMLAAVSFILSQQHPPEDHRIMFINADLSKIFQYLEN